MDITIRTTHSGVRSVLAMDAEWESRTEDERIDLSVMWDEDLDQIEVIEEANRRGDLSASQVAARARLVDDLRRALPILEERDLEKPPRQIFGS